MALYHLGVSLVIRIRNAAMGVFKSYKCLVLAFCSECFGVITLLRTVDSSVDSSFMCEEGRVVESRSCDRC